MSAGTAVPAGAGGPGSRREKEGGAETRGGEKEASPSIQFGQPNPRA